jgi:hypothetical protein
MNTVATYLKAPLLKSFLKISIKSKSDSCWLKGKE